MQAFALFSLLGCPSPAPAPTDSPTVLPPTPTDEPLPTADTAVEVPEVDCRELPSVEGGTVLTSPRAYHGIAFDGLGNMAGSDGTSLLLSTSPTETSLFVPQNGTLQQMAYLPNGDLVVAGDTGGRIDLVHPNGIVETLANGIGAYGVTVGPDGFVYTANQTQIHQIDPTGVLPPRVWLPTTQINVPKVITFNREGTSAFVGTNNRGGNVFRVDVDAEGEPILPVVPLGQTGGTWHDAITLDACGNLYVNEYFTATLYRRAYGEDVFRPFVRFGELGGVFNDLYGHGMTFGSGIGAWSATSAYMPLPYNGNRVGELDLGVPGRDFNGGNYTVIR